MTNSNKLKPCPWPSCGSDSVRIRTRYIQSFVWCAACDAKGPHGANEAEATRLWNERAGGDVAGIEISADGTSVTVTRDGYCYKYDLADFCSEKGATDANGHE